MIRQQIWTNLVNVKFKTIYLGHLISRNQKNSLRTSSEIILSSNKKITDKSNIETDNYIRNHYGYNFRK